MKNRLILCLLVCGVLLYYAVPNLSVHAQGLEGIFSIVWLAFACIVIGGNLVGLLYHPKKQSKIENSIKESNTNRKQRQYV